MGVPDGAGHDEWVDEEAGPLVRPFTMTRGRAQPAKARFDLVSMVTATQAVPPQDAELTPEHLDIVRLCQHPLSVAEVAAHLSLPLGTVRVLLDDLLHRKLVRTLGQPSASGHLHDSRVLQAVIDGLRAL